MGMIKGVEDSAKVHSTVQLQLPPAGMAKLGRRRTD